MFKNKKVIAIILAIAIIVGAAGWYAYDRHQSALAAEQARQEELAKAEAEKKAAEEEAAKKAEEEKKAAEEAATKLDEQGRGPLERMMETQKATPEQQKAIEEAMAALTPEEKAKQEEANKKDNAEYDAIRKMLEAYNKAQNSRDYRTVTGLEGIEYMVPDTEFYKWYTNPKKVASVKEVYQDKKLVTAFDGIVIHALRFMEDNFQRFSDDLYAPRTEAYVEVETIVHDVEPVPSDTRSLMAAVLVKKVDGEWKVYHEQELTK
jgi:chemotaxis protein histidine kinase CheA